MAENREISDSLRIKIASHADVAVEEKHYIEMESERLREAINKLQTFFTVAPKLKNQKKKKPLKSSDSNGFKAIHPQGLEPWTP